MGKIITLTGCSGSGKSTIAEKLLQEDDFRLLTSYTTRSKRKTDLEGEYEYLTLPQFARMKSQRQFLWITEHANVWYGTTVSSVDEAKKQKKHSIMILVPSVLPDLHFYAENSVMSFLIEAPPRKIMRQRLRQRGDTEEQINKRINAEHGFYRNVEGISYIHIQNKQGELERAVETIKNWI